MRDDGVELGVVLDPAKVAVVLYRYERVVPEHLQRERVVEGREGLRLERVVISLEQHLHYVQHSGLSGPGAAVENEELLDILAVACDYASDSPFYLLPLDRIVQGPYEFLPRVQRARLYGIREPLADVVVLRHLVVGEGQLRVELVVVVREGRAVEQELAPFLGGERLHVGDLRLLAGHAYRPVVLPELLVHYPAHGPGIPRPHAGLLVPHRVEGRPLYHEVVGCHHYEFRIHLHHWYRIGLRRRLLDGPYAYEIEHSMPPLLSSRATPETPETGIREFARFFDPPLYIYILFIIFILLLIHTYNINIII